jgi:hypothetical protein
MSAHSCGETSTVVRCLGPKVLGEDFAVRRAGYELNAQLFPISASMDLVPQS